MKFRIYLITIITLFFTSGCFTYNRYNYMPQPASQTTPIKYPGLKIGVVSGWDARPFARRENYNIEKDLVTLELFPLILQGLYLNIKAEKLFSECYLNPPTWSDLDLVLMLYLFSNQQGEPVAHLEFFTPHNLLNIAPLEVSLGKIGGMSLNQKQYPEVTKSLNTLKIAACGRINNALSSADSAKLTDERERDYFRMIDPGLDSLRDKMKAAKSANKTADLDRLSGEYEKRIDQMTILRLTEADVCKDYTKAIDQLCSQQVKIIDDVRYNYLSLQDEKNWQDNLNMVNAGLAIVSSAAAIAASTKGNTAQANTLTTQAGISLLALEMGLKVSQQMDNALNQMQQEITFNIQKVESEPEIRQRLEKYPEYKNILAYDIWEYRQQFITKYRKLNLPKI